MNGKIENIVFLDLDHVLTNTMVDNTSFWSYDPSKYKLSTKNCEALDKILGQCNAKIVIASNWRRFEWPNIWWEFKGKRYCSILEQFKKLYNGIIIDMLPKDRHITKCEALELWFDDNRWFSKTNGKYVILEDDLQEGYQSHPIFCKHLILTDYRYGLTDDDANKAIEILNR